MNILEKLAELANKLDKKGLYAEAAELDTVIKEAVEPFYEAAPPGWQNVFYQAPMGYRESPEERSRRITEEGLAKLRQMDETGMAGKGQPRLQKDPNVLAFQKQYNAIWDQLKGMGLRMREGFGPRLDEDAMRGPKTMRAERLFPRLQAILKNELQKQ